jgi:hypothetical protein
MTGSLKLPWACVGLVLVFGLPAPAAALESYVQSTTGLGSGFLLQDIHGQIRLPPPDAYHTDGTFLRHRVEDDDLPAPKPRDVYPIQLGVDLGYRLYNHTSPADAAGTYTDTLHTFYGGGTAEFFERLTLAGGGSYSVMPSEKYTIGGIFLKGEYTMRFGTPSDEAGDPAYQPRGVQDAREEYERRKREREKREEEPSGPAFPALRMQARGGFDRHSQGKSDDLPLTRTLSADNELNAAMAHAELTFMPTYKYRLRAGASLGFYDRRVDDFLAFQSQGQQRLRPLTALAYYLGFSDRLLALPQQSYDLSAGADLSPKLSLDLFFNSTIYQSAVQDTSTGFGGWGRVELSAAWEGAAGFDVTSYADVSEFVGLFTLRYRP